MRRLSNYAIPVSAWICVIAASLTACMAPSATSASASEPATHTPASEKSVRVAGVLTLKGPELGAWWALTDASGAVWRLDSSNPEQLAQFRQWQNQRIEVDAVSNGAYLSTLCIRVTKAQLKPQ